MLSILKMYFLLFFLCIYMYFLPISSRWWAPATRAYARINLSTPLQFPAFVDGIFRCRGFPNFRETSWNLGEFLIFQYFTNLKTPSKRNKNLTLSVTVVFFFSAWPEKLMKSVHPFHLSFDWLSEWLPNQDKILEIILLLFGCFWVIFGLRGSLRSFFAWKHHPQTSSPERFCTAAHCRTPRYPCKPRIQCDVVTWGGWNDTETYRQGNRNNEKKHENIV